MPDDDRILEYRSPPPPRATRREWATVAMSFAFGVAYFVWVVLIDHWVNGHLLGIWSHDGPRRGLTCAGAAVLWVGQRGFALGPVFVCWALFAIGGLAGYAPASLLLRWTSGPRPVPGPRWWRMWLLIALWLPWILVPSDMTILAMLD